MNEVIPVVYSAEIAVGFYPGNVCCDGCRFMTDDSRSRGRKVCFLTDEIIHYPKQTGMRCPLEPVKEETQNA